MSSLFSVVVLLFVAFTASQACSCSKPHPRNAFCRSSFVFRARVLSGPRNDVAPQDNNFFGFVDQVYSLKIVEIFKGKENVTQVNGVYSFGVRNPSLMADLFTPSSIFSCDVQLKPGTEYLLTGHIYDHDRKLRMNLCNWHPRWTNVTPSQREGLKGRFNAACWILSLKTFPHRRASYPSTFKVFFWRFSLLVCKRNRNTLSSTHVKKSSLFYELKIFLRGKFRKQIMLTVS